MKRWLVLALLVGTLVACREAPKSEKKAEATPMGMSSAVTLVPTANPIEVLATLPNADDLALDGARLLATTSDDGGERRRVVAIPLATGGAPQTLFADQSAAESVTRAGDRLAWLLAPSEEDADHTRIAVARLGDKKPKVIAKLLDIEKGNMIADGNDLLLFGRTDPKSETSIQRLGGDNKLVRVANVTGPLRTTLAVNGTHVVWAEGGGIVRSPKRGPAGNVETVVPAATMGINLQNLVADDDAVVWTYRGRESGEWSSRVMRVTFADKKVETVSDAPFSNNVAIDRDTIYWVSASPHGGRVLARKKSGGPTFVLARDLKGPSDVQVDDRYVYWLNRGDGTVCRAEKTPRRS